MGFNTGILLLNDAMGGIEENPGKFWENMRKAIFIDFQRYPDKPTYFSVGNHSNGGTVFHMAHADVNSVYAIGGNCTTRLLPSSLTWSHHTPEDKLAIVNQMADEIGFELVPKAKKKRK